MTISVVIPVLNERSVLPQNLHTLLSEPAIAEIIIVDGGSTDGTIDYLNRLQHPKTQLLHSDSGRGRQMNVGARQATGKYLLFHHADSRLPSAALAELRHELGTSQPMWGGFRHQFSESEHNWKLRLVSWLHNFRFRHSGVIYGDQSMFVRRRFFEELGGFEHQDLEDMLFSEMALEASSPTMLNSSVVTDSRKFQQIGELRALWHVLSIILRYQFDKQIANGAFFKAYR